MASPAYEEWAGVRQDRIAELFRAHAAAAAQGEATEQLEWALVIRLAAEFQGYVRALHSAVAHALVGRLREREPLARVLRAALTNGRWLDRGNATKDTIAKDFGRFAINPLGAVVTSYAGGAAWADALRTLNDVRNRIAHGDTAAIAEAAGGPVDADRVRRWYAALRELAAALDAVTANAVATTTGGPAPW